MSWSTSPNCTVASFSLFLLRFNYFSFSHRSCLLASVWISAVCAHHEMGAPRPPPPAEASPVPAKQDVWPASCCLPGETFLSSLFIHIHPGKYHNPGAFSRQGTFSPFHGHSHGFSFLRSHLHHCPIEFHLVDFLLLLRWIRIILNSNPVSQTARSPFQQSVICKFYRCAPQYIIHRDNENIEVVWDSNPNVLPV